MNKGLVGSIAEAVESGEGIESRERSQFFRRRCYKWNPVKELKALGLQ